MGNIIYIFNVAVVVAFFIGCVVGHSFGAK